MGKEGRRKEAQGEAACVPALKSHRRTWGDGGEKRGRDRLGEGLLGDKGLEKPGGGVEWADAT